MRKPDNKPKRRKILHSYESLHLQRSKSLPTQQQTLDKVGYRSKEEYSDCAPVQPKETNEEYNQSRS